MPYLLTLYIIEQFPIIFLSAEGAEIPRKVYLKLFCGRFAEGLAEHPRKALAEGAEGIPRKGQKDLLNKKYYVRYTYRHIPHIARMFKSHPGRRCMKMFRRSGRTAQSDS